MAKVSDFKDQSDAELKALYHDLSKEIYQMRNELNVTRKIEKPHLMREKKRDRARVLTVLRQREIAVTGQG